MPLTASRLASADRRAPLVIVAIAVPLFLTPLWVAFEQGAPRRPPGPGSPSRTPDRHRRDPGRPVIGPPDFDVAVAGEPVLNERERGHMRDVRGVFIGFFAVAAARRGRRS